MSYLNLLTRMGHFQKKHNKEEELPNIVLVSIDMVPPEFFNKSLDSLDIRTPNIDKLKKGGVSFSSAWCASPLCAPSRAAYLTGRHPYITGNSERAHDGHATELRENDVIFPAYLKAVGYHTRHIGKSHVGVKHFIEAFSENDSPWHRWSPPWYDDDQYLVFLREQGLETFTFAHSIIGRNKNGEEGNHYGGWLASQKGIPFPEGATYPSFLVEKAIQNLENYLEQQEKKDEKNKPFYLQLEFFGPHQPFAIPGGYEKREEELRDVVNLPDSYIELLNNNFISQQEEPRVYKMYRKNWQIYDKQTALDYRVANILQMELQDKMLGKFFDYLERRKIYEKTHILFIADHGEMNTKKALIDKGAYLNPQVMRVPFIIKPAKNTWTENIGTICNEKVSLMDIAPTLLTFANIKDQEYRDGYDLNELIKENRPKDKPILFDVWNHVVANPAVGTIFTGSDNNDYLFTYNIASEFDELYLCDDFALNNVFTHSEYKQIRKEALEIMQKRLQSDVRWRVYQVGFELEYAEEINLKTGDRQLFE